MSERGFNVHLTEVTEKMPNEEKSGGGFKNFIMNLTPYSKRKTGFLNELQRLMITIGLLLMLQLVFWIVDVTFPALTLNKAGTFVNNIAGTGAFDWITIYDNPAFQFITVIGVLHIIYLVIKTITLGVKVKNKKFV